MKLSIFFHIVIPILCGVIIYALWRGIYFIDPTQKIFPLAYLNNRPNWLLYNLPDGLWFYALLSAIAFIWKPDNSIFLLIWLFGASAMAFLSEFLQLFYCIPGTFDYYDLLAYSIALLIFYCFNFHQINKLFFIRYKYI